MLHYAVGGTFTRGNFSESAVNILHIINLTELEQRITVPVSYTHLDVYKRHALSYVVFTFLQIKITLPGGDATSIHLGNAVCVLGALILGGLYGGVGEMCIRDSRYINRDENTHLWLFRNIILELQKEEPQLFTSETIAELKEMLMEGVRQEIEWGHYCIGRCV